MAEYDEAHGIAFTSTNAVTQKQGFNITCNEDLEIVSITKSSSVTATKAYLIVHNTGVELGNATFSGNTATFASPIAITAGTTYRVVCDKAGATYTQHYKLTNPYPINGTYINWVAGSSGGSIYDSFITCISAVRVSIDEPAPASSLSYAKGMKKRNFKFMRKKRKKVESIYIIKKKVE